MHSRTKRTGRWKKIVATLATAQGIEAASYAQCFCIEERTGLPSMWIDFEEINIFDACVPMTKPPPIIDIGPDSYTSIEKDMVIYDFDVDGDQDVVVAQKYVHNDDGYANPTKARNLFLRMEGGVFTCANTLVGGFSESNSARDVALIDLDVDGYMDFVITNTKDEPPRAFRNRGFDANQTWLGFEELVNWLALGQSYTWWSCSLAVADLDCDGRADLAFGDYGPGFNGNTTGDRVFLNRMNTTGQFIDITDLAYFAMGQSVPFWHSQAGPFSHNNTGIQLIDADSDGAVDLFRSLGGTGGEVVWNTVSCPSVSGPYFGSYNVAIQGTAPYMLLMADIDGDGLADGYSGGDNCDTVTLNNGNANPSLWPSHTVQSARVANNAGNVISVDLDNDNLLDWAVCDIDQTAEICSTTTGLCLLRTSRDNAGNAVGTADPNEIGNSTNQTPCLGGANQRRDVIDLPWNTDAVYDVVFFDYNLDGYQDMLLGTCDGFKFFRMKPFAEKDPSCACAPATVKLAIDGNPSVSQNALVLKASGAPAFKNGTFLYSFTKSQGIPNSDGTLCIGPANIARLDQITSNSSGEFSYELDLTTGPPSSGNSQILPGTKVYFQLRYRDPAGPTGVNYSDVIEVTFWE